MRLADTDPVIVALISIVLGGIAIGISIAKVWLR